MPALISASARVARERAGLIWLPRSALREPMPQRHAFARSRKLESPLRIRSRRARRAAAVVVAAVEASRMAASRAAIAVAIVATATSEEGLAVVAIRRPPEITQAEMPREASRLQPVVAAAIAAAITVAAIAAATAAE